jgi:hypothetical protein
MPLYGPQRLTTVTKVKVPDKCSALQARSMLVLDPAQHTTDETIPVYADPAPHAFERAAVTGLPGPAAALAGR